MLHLGLNPARTKEAWRGRKGNLQSLGKHRLLFRSATSSAAVRKKNFSRKVTWFFACCAPASRLAEWRRYGKLFAGKAIFVAEVLVVIGLVSFFADGHAFLADPELNTNFRLSHLSPLYRP